MASYLNPGFATAQLVSPKNEVWEINPRFEEANGPVCVVSIVFVIFPGRGAFQLDNVKNN